jgi:putative oxidoreductase
MSSTRPFSNQSAFAARHVDAALLVLRIVIGVVFIAHGYQKVFTMGLANVAGGFAKMGIPMPQIMGPAIGVLELVGGIAILIGIFTRVFAFLIMCDMIGAMATVHFKNGFFMPTGYEFALTLALVSLALVLSGAGQFSADDAIAERRADKRGLA